MHPIISCMAANKTHTKGGMKNEVMPHMQTALRRKELIVPVWTILIRSTDHCIF